MGQEYKVKCQACGKEWKHHETAGDITAFYYCHKCGKMKVIEYLNDRKVNNGCIQLISVGVTCGCGDKFKISGQKIVCPVCHSKQTIVEKEHIVVWD